MKSNIICWNNFERSWENTSKCYQKYRKLARLTRKNFAKVLKTINPENGARLGDSKDEIQL